MPKASTSRPGRIPQVAVLVDTSRSYGRDIVRGIRRYVAENGPWSLYLEPRDLRSRFPDWLKDWPGDGILSRTVDDVMLRQLKATKLPVVELRTTVLPHSFPFVGMDNSVVATRVAEHLRNRGFRRFACYFDTTEAFFVERSERFAQTLREHGFECAMFKSSRAGKKSLRWDEHQRALSEWLASLEKPVGVFAVNDQLGFWLLDAARRAGIAVPEEVAVVGAENDNMLCETASPPLSSARLRGQAVGYEAARILDEWMKKKRIPKPGEQHLLAPGDIAVRQSSDIVAVEDPRIAAALRFIRQHATEQIDVTRVARETALSRSVLERRMKALIGRSPGEEINRIRFAAVEKLLTQTDLTLDAIAARCGFTHPQYMAEAFRNRTGITPGAFRKQRAV
ncbi:DNA-binding transcriptional regulator [Prosthecobacter sp.]|uniref:AraC family transcriptional regulator n=1 Tax=Prosthecobacter sp. TaxID=1965333 RepID=UPI001D875E98|nr:DNA-binding transcriptional regulator [Prosthecobacter sp.]MCB1279713.1 DNA-binding transcriptional regulator [Prosthecobacter sp.]